jgi:hypothetical protein
LLKAGAAGGGRGSFCQEGRREGREASKTGDSRVNDVLIINYIKRKVTEVDCVFF